MTPRIPSWGPFFKATFSINEQLDISGLKSEVEKGLAFIELGHPTRDSSNSAADFMQRYTTCSQVRAVARITDIQLSDGVVIIGVQATGNNLTLLRDNYYALSMRKLSSCNKEILITLDLVPRHTLDQPISIQERT